VNGACPTELTLSMHADCALSPGDAVATEQHLATCADCRARLAALRSEAGIVAAALSHDDVPVTVPAYKHPVSRLAVVATAAGGMFVAALIAVVPDLIGGLLQGPVTWFNPFDAGTLADLGVDAAIYLAKHGGAIMTSLAKTALMAAFTTLVGWLAFARRRRNGAPLLLAALLGIAALQPLPSHALEIRHDEKSVYVPAGETIDDTLIIVGESVEVAGDVTGDLIAVGKRVVVRGHIGGQVFAAGESVDIDGEVGGSVTGIAETLGVSAPLVGRNLYGIGATISLKPAAAVAANAIVAGEHVQLAGSIGRDVLGGGDSFDVSGSVGGALSAYAQALTLFGSARIGGNVTAYVKQADDLIVTPGAVIGGEVKTQIVEGHGEKNRYLTGGFYLAQLLRFAAAFLTGVIVLALVPSLRRMSIDSGSQALTAGGVGLVTLVATPIIAVLAAITIIGLPVGVFGLLLWCVGIYLAKVVIARFVGARLLEVTDNPRHYMLTLALGLTVVIVLINLPLIGGVLNFLLTILGLGLLVLFLKRTYDEGDADRS
jgi:hypothetical protein